MLGHARHARVSTTGDVYVHTDSLIAKESSEILAKAIRPAFVAEISGKPNQ